MGTGTGLVGIYLGLKFQQDKTQVQITLTDLEKPSLDIAKENVDLNELTNTKVEYFKWAEFYDETNAI